MDEERGHAATTTVAARFPPGSLFDGKYRIERVLGAGGMGVVLAATHLKLDERVAIKVVLPELAGNAEVVERFLREGRAAVKIRSEHVARVMDVEATEDGTPYLVMEYLEGSDLGDVVEKRGRLPLDEAAGYLLQACEAVAQAHALGVVHRDLKPANLFLTTGADGQPCIKVLDFGISKMGAGSALASDDHGLTKTSSMMGSPAYMAPEQMRSTRAVDARTDIWAMGTILYELLTGAPPFNGTTMADLLVTILQDAHTPVRRARPDLPPAVDGVVSRCLEKEPDRRFPSVAELAVALEPLAPPGSAALVTRIQRTLAKTPRPSSAEIRLDGAAETGLAAAPAPAKTAGAWAGAPALATKLSPVGIAGACTGLVAVVALGIVMLGHRDHAAPVESPAAAAPARASDLPSVAASTAAPAAPVPPAAASIAEPPSVAPEAPDTAPAATHAPAPRTTPPSKAKTKAGAPGKPSRTTVDDRHG